MTAILKWFPHVAKWLQKIFSTLLTRRPLKEKRNCSDSNYCNIASARVDRPWTIYTLQNYTLSTSTTFAEPKGLEMTYQFTHVVSLKF